MEETAVISSSAVPCQESVTVASAAEWGRIHLTSITLTELSNVHRGIVGLSTPLSSRGVPFTKTVRSSPRLTARAPSTSAPPPLPACDIIEEGLPKTQGSVILTLHLFREIFQRFEFKAMHRGSLNLRVHGVTQPN